MTAVSPARGIQKVFHGRPHGRLHPGHANHDPHAARHIKISGLRRCFATILWLHQFPTPNGVVIWRRHQHQQSAPPPTQVALHQVLDTACQPILLPPRFPSSSEPIFDNPCTGRRRCASHVSLFTLSRSFMRCCEIVRRVPGRLYCAVGL